MNDDAELLRQYADQGSEEAFAELVRRHLSLVYHAALRQTGGDAHRAQDVAQEVFTSLARKARSLAQRPTLAGWLHTSTRYASLQLLRTERRRQTREQEVFAMTDSIEPDSSAADWERLKPVVDEALHALNERDREAVLLRYFEGRPFAEVGAKLAVTEDAARVRVDRALDKLRATLARHGVTSTAAALALALTGQAGAAVPSGLAATVTSGALVAGAAPAAIFAFMNLTHIKIALAIGVASAGAATVVVQHQENQALRTELAQVSAANKVPSPDAALSAENARLKASLAQLESLRSDDTALIELMGEESGIKTKAIESLRKRATSSEATIARLSARLADLSSYGASELDSSPVPTFQTPIVFPAGFKSTNEDEVIMEFVVDSAGATKDVKAIHATQEEIATAAIDAVKQWKFNPGLKGGIAVNAKVVMPIKFAPPKSSGQPKS